LEFKPVRLVQGLAATWRHAVFIAWTLAMALPWWQHYKHCRWYYY